MVLVTFPTINVLTSRYQVLPIFIYPYPLYMRYSFLWRIITYRLLFAPELYPYVYRSVYYYTISVTLQNAELIVRGMVERRRERKRKREGESNRQIHIARTLCIETENYFILREEQTHIGLYYPTLLIRIVGSVCSSV